LCKKNKLDSERIAALVNHYPVVGGRFEQEIQAFVAWLRELAVKLDS
jgi:hypothetical protein